jgi:hypothetical protein
LQISSCDRSREQRPEQLSEQCRLKSDVDLVRVARTQVSQPSLSYLPTGLYRFPSRFAGNQGAVPRDKSQSGPEASLNRPGMVGLC